ncbi:hypothetical protein PAHAL_8G167400 [Panicum hallii]|uniref:Uncharacterized protein n=1 Tax=Panicum hallii TaxID=206008 RepID=A0A2S3IEJ5_9POAL|nr:hypothetical protein PAHAL_8G167400 [Panicum hallii]
MTSVGSSSQRCQGRQLVSAAGADASPTLLCSSTSSTTCSWCWCCLSCNHQSRGILEQEGEWLRCCAAPCALVQRLMQQSASATAPGAPVAVDTDDVQQLLEEMPLRLVHFLISQVGNKTCTLTCIANCPEHLY